MCPAVSGAQLACHAHREKIYLYMAPFFIQNPSLPNSNEGVRAYVCVCVCIGIMCVHTLIHMPLSSRLPDTNMRRRFLDSRRDASAQALVLLADLFLCLVGDNVCRGGGVEEEEEEEEEDGR